MPLAAEPQKSGVSFDLRLYLREDKNDGHLWAEVAFLDRETGKLLHNAKKALPLRRPEDVGWYVDQARGSHWRHSSGGFVAPHEHACGLPDEAGVQAVWRALGSL